MIFDEQVPEPKNVETDPSLILSENLFVKATFENNKLNPPRYKIYYTKLYLIKLLLIRTNYEIIL